ncbi:MAG TPA: tRNA (N(6)-L-threonylcarbamoyladenosine(37)-C(2))-methylthiotransferase MtaB [Candidatus Polarisedimenticolia bacterium]|nr:tRNA (N(6)-L-threonylcarbamoyladenosine(37)-C(2))-methylthiotransferase MtaB [Candidatus Polarisedimenticolia bacterium]
MRYHKSVLTYHVQNFGCRVTQADGAALERQLDARGLASAPAAQADIVLLNTCTVTNSADQDARAAIRRISRQNPLAKIIVTGCYAQRAPYEIAALPGVAAVIGNSHKHQLADLVLGEKSRQDTTFLPLSTLTDNRELRAENLIFVSDIFAHTELLAAPVFESADSAASHPNDRTRPNLKIQDGCDNRCSFCVIPSVRGQSRSLPPHQVIREMNTLVAAGYREVVISGINLGRWGRDLRWGGPSRAPKLARNNAPQSFEDLIRLILSDTQLEKLRISSVEPMDWSDDLISLVASSPRIAKHAHVPLQSASDAVLRRMHRKYRPWHYREKIEKIRAAMPTAAIGADVMAGFPGETDAEFESTRRLIEDLPFTYLHVFTYSARPGTPAAAMPNQVPVHVARERNKILRDLADQKKQIFLHSFIGKPLEAITLGTFGGGTSAREVLGTPRPAPDSASKSEQEVSSLPFTEALTDNYQKLFVKGRHTPNRWITAHIEKVKDGALVGTPASPQSL